MKPEEVAAWLKEHPEFFEQYAELMSEITIPHPHGGRAIPISERQTLTLREKSRQLEAKLRELIQFGEENDAIGEKVHRMSAALLAASDIPGVLNSVYLNLREDFAVPHVALRVWRTSNHAGLPEFKPVSDAAREFAAGLANPHCGAHAVADTAGLFGEAAAHLRSFSYVPLRDSETFGLLALASEDPQRFYPEMGTLYLKRLGELVGAAMARHLNQ
ncbi:MAG TPA: DUF484 family protein [Burkholderiales bacterium]|nr:DUF484 family protein [Burkholderiales bacterium]